MLAALFACGCMKIYPDAELPDIEATWAQLECDPAIGGIHVVVVDYDDEVIAVETTVPCAEKAVRFPDLALRRYVVGGEALALGGAGYSSAYSYEADLRDGFGERVEMYFGTRANVRVAWTLEGGARCGELGVSTVFLEAEATDFRGTINAADCRVPPLLHGVGENVQRLRLRTVDDLGFTSLVSPLVDVTIDPSPEFFLDLGTLTLARCGASCP